MKQLALAMAMGLGLGLLAGCTALPATDSLTVRPVLRINHSAEQTAASWYQLGQYHQQRGQFDLARAAYAASAALNVEASNPAAYKQPNPTSAMKPAVAAAKKTANARPAKAEVAVEAGPALPSMELVQIGPHEYRLRYQQLPALQAERAPTERPTAAKALLRMSARAPVHAPVHNSADRSTRLEIANGSGAPGVAKKTSRLLLKHGINVAKLSNERPYRQQRTEIQYQRGHKKEALALKRTLGGTALVVRFNAGADVHANTGLRLVLGKDAVHARAGAGRTLAAN